MNPYYLTGHTPGFCATSLDDTPNIPQAMVQWRDVLFLDDRNVEEEFGFICL